jgi:hypothetical protein
MPDYTVTAGDCFDSIAKDNSFYNYQTVYKNGNNATNWPNPNMLVAGGKVDVPDKNVKKVDLTLDGTVQVVVDRKKTRLRIVLVDSAFNPIKAASCKATLDIEYPKPPEANGLLELSDINPLVKDGTLVLTPAVPPPPTASAKPATTPDPNAYPVPIVEKDFTDKDPKAGDRAKLEWTLKIGQLEPHTTVRGVLQRLVNLGFGCPAQTVEDDKTSAAVKAYQLNIQLKKKGQETGKAADIGSDIQKRHDQL